MYQAYSDIQQIRTHYNYDIQLVQDAKWGIIENVIEENVEKAKIQSNAVKQELSTKLLYEYSGRMQTLHDDLMNKNNSVALDIMNSEIDGVYLNIKAERNRMYIADKNGILADKGFTSSSKDSRDWNNEISAKINKDLATKAVAMVLTKNDKMIYWKDFVNTQYDVNADSDDNEPSMSALKAKYLPTHNIDVFDTYDILVPAYISNDGDIFSVPDVSPHGIKNDNSKIIVIQEFNIYDAIIMHKDELERYDLIETYYDKELTLAIDRKINSFVLSIFISLLSFIGILLAANIFIKWGGDDVTRGCNKG